MTDYSGGNGMLTGDYAVGKTSIIKRYCTGLFSPNYKLTIGVDFAVKEVTWDKNTTVSLQLWDIAGHERFGTMTRVYYKYAIAAIIVFDLGRPTTFEAVTKWRDDINSKVVLGNQEPIPVLLLANKCDIKEAVIDTEMLDNFVKKHNFIGWFATSAQGNINIEEAMMFLTGKVLDVAKTNQPPKPDENLLQVGLDKRDQSKKGGSGSVGGMSSIMVGHPFDTIKVLLQDGSGGAPKFQNGYQALRYTVQIDGIKGVYRGLSVPLVSVSVINSVFFATNNYAQKYLHPTSDTLIPFHKVAIAGGIAGGVISFFITPRDLIKSKLQVQSRNSSLLATVTTKGGAPPREVYKGPIDCIRQIVNRNGVLGLFRGIRPTLCRDIPGDMMYFSVYEFMKRKLLLLSNSSGSTDSFPAWVAIGAGGCAGMSFWASIYPLDVIKTRIQTQPDPALYRGIIHCATEIYKKEGFSTFYRGFSATIFRAFPTSAVNFLMYETTKKLLNSKFAADDLPAGLEAT
eukprot:gene20428-24512_t